MIKKVAILIAFLLTLSFSTATQGIDQVVTKLTTSDGTQSTCGTWAAPADGVVIYVLVVVSAINTGTGDSKGWVLGGFYERVSGSTSLLGSLQNLIAGQGSVGATTWAATLDVSSNSVRVRVTGVAATSIKWQTTITPYFQGE